MSDRLWDQPSMMDVKRSNHDRASDDRTRGNQTRGGSTGHQPTVTVEISGGLGNQLFQYAAGRSLAVRWGATLRLDIGFYRRRRHREFLLPRMGVTARTISPSPFRQTLSQWPARWSMSLRRNATMDYREPHFHFDPAWMRWTDPKSNVTLRGYFQSPRYFADHASLIAQDLTFLDHRKLNASENDPILDLIQTHAALHVRRGDYVSNPKASRIYAVCDLEYYADAMSRLPADCEVFVFSDDPAWARRNLPRVRRLRFPETSNDALIDLRRISRARHHIIANSTFSWWGAWLANQRHRRDRSSLNDIVTIAPNRWFNDSSIRDDDLIPPTWTRI